ncbi:MAG: SIR2 family protein [Chloroflexi bacterium]|nr:SIR2 family protein [Chloroflexota bacterium]
MILVFAGAGASAAVNPEQYPTTTEFFSRVPSEIRKSPWFREASLFLKSVDNDSRIDIEKVLGTLAEMRDYCTKSSDTTAFPGWVLQPGQNRFSRLAETSEGELIDYDPFASLNDILESMKKTVRSLDELEDDINRLVYELYAARPNHEALETWVNLLQFLHRHDLHTEVFTTNYDLVLEDAILAGGLSESIGTGRVTDGVNSTIDLDKWHSTSEEIVPTFSGPGLLTKLHGSVDWQRGSDGRIIVGSSRFTGEHQNHILIYPGFKGEPQDEPFSSFHNRLRLVAERATAAIFIGYAFRDEFINEVLSDIRPKITKFVINKEQTAPSLDFLSGSAHFEEGFTEDSVQAFKRLLV